MFVPARLMTLTQYCGCSLIISIAPSTNTTKNLLDMFPPVSLYIPSTRHDPRFLFDRPQTLCRDRIGCCACRRQIERARLLRKAKDEKRNRFRCAPGIRFGENIIVGWNIWLIGWLCGASKTLNNVPSRCVRTMIVAIRIGGSTVDDGA